jgi:hypothetical protein
MRQEGQQERQGHGAVGILSNHLGLHRRDLWLARNWANVGNRVVHPVAGAIVVWRHHVGIISAVDGSSCSRSFG